MNNELLGTLNGIITDLEQLKETVKALEEEVKELEITKADR